ncbi:LamG domain-containing protein [Mangrovivirga sp. M17]|uniref:LamG domain-containing protein n=1 Tax=Mangrovivirga halotolerans TaxID=2993936 RepID=A0ABT3RPV5_9BACT|nr:LamG domain-containing protein [Mangrovivirga halotolerans]MCX2743640.1 LamG domain-containing protein [Mangrovivirga halotolerans]
MRIFKINAGIAALLSLCFFVITSSCNPDEEVGPEEVNDIPRDGLVAFYPFNGNFNDESGVGDSAAHLVNNGGSLTTDRYGNPNSAYSANFNEYLVANNGKFEFESDFTISVWVKSERNEENKNTEIFVYNNGYELGYLADFINKYNCVIDDYKIVESNEYDNPTDWHHVCFSYQANNRETKIYVDGVLNASKIHGEGRVAIRTSEIYFFGGELYYFPYVKFNGQGDDIAVYNRLLTVNEVKQLFNQEITK